jgi:phage shock protein C
LPGSNKEDDVDSYRRPFRVNSSEGKVMGVCAGIADHFDVDVSLVRIGMAIAVLTTFPMMLIAYFIVAMVASEKERRSPRSAPPPTRQMGAPCAEATRQRMRDLDARMQAVESYVTSTNTALAREIDELR